MSPEVNAAIIAAGVGVLTVIATVVAQYLGRRATSRDTQKALKEQRKQLDQRSRSSASSWTGRLRSSAPGR